MHGLDRAFARIGACVRISPSPTVRVGVSPEGTFLLELPAGAEALALSVAARHRHLLLLVRGSDDRFLCGHDERAWFVAGLPASARVSTVDQALHALKRDERGGRRPYRPGPRPDELDAEGSVHEPRITRYRRCVANGPSETESFSSRIPSGSESKSTG